MKPSAHALIASAARFGAAPTQAVRLAHLSDPSADVRRLAWLELLRRCPGYRILAEEREKSAV